MVDWTKKFKPEYEAARTALAKTSDYATDWKPLVTRLHKLMGDTGFDAGQEEALSLLRTNIVKGASQTKTTEDKGLLTAAGAWADGNTGTLTSEAKKRVAALKMLRHVYLLNKAGSRKVWIHSLPVEFNDWPSRKLQSGAPTMGDAKTLLRSSNEHFSEQQKRYLGNTVYESVAWCQKAGMVLANAGAAAGPSATAGRTQARAMVSRWFAEPGLADATLDTHIATLAAGFKKLLAMLGRGNFVVTDWVPFRGTSDADEQEFLDSEAFTFRGNGEGMDVVYIESSFFATGGNVLSGQKNWTRIMVHELTHLVCGTTDVDNGDTRYAWYGIGPHSGYPSTDCIKNAENWAFFAADCAGQLSDSERNEALTII
jgi:hypothetical protein